MIADVVSLPNSVCKALSIHDDSHNKLYVLYRQC